MQTKDIQIPYRKINSNFYLYWLADIHAGTVHCLPQETEILTRDGFQHWQELHIGQEVLGFNGQTLCWTNIEKIHTFASMPMVKLSSRSFEVVCSPDHQWLVTDRTRKGIRKPLLYKVPTSLLKKHHRILTIASPNDTEKGKIKLSVEEASLLGWLITDGSIRGDPYINWYVFQSKEPYKTLLRLRFGHWFTNEETKPSSPTHPLEHSRFHLKASKVRKLLRKLNTTSELLLSALPSIVTRISTDARMAMLESMVQAEGSLNVYGKWNFTQKANNPQIEIFVILATLCGFRLGKHCLDKKTGVANIHLLNHRNVDVANLQISEYGSMPVWCPTTTTGNWVARYKNQITLTGNCVEDHVKRKVDEIKKRKNAYWLGGGDYAEFITPKDKRFDPNLKSIAEWVEPDNIAHCQVEWLTKLFDPIKGKCLGLLYGNHENSIRIFNHDNVIKNLCENLGVDNLGFSCFLRLFFKRDNSNEAHLVKGVFTHGASGAITEGAKLMALMRFMNMAEADLYGYAHIHDYIQKSRSRITISPQGKIKGVVSIGCTAGAWFRTYTKGIIASYGEQKVYPPTEICCAMFTINPNTGFIDVQRSV